MNQPVFRVMRLPGVIPVKSTSINLELFGRLGTLVGSELWIVAEETKKENSGGSPPTKSRRLKGKMEYNGRLQSLY